MAQAYELKHHARSGRGLIVLALVGLMTMVLPGTSPAAAAAPTCPDGRSDAEGVQGSARPPAVTVRIDTPVSGERLSGTVQVEGTARSVAPLSRVELVRAGSVLAFQDFAPSPTVTFSLPWDTARGPIGRMTLHVLACGPSAGGKTFVEVVVASRRPLWVGVVIGLAGVGGLVLAFRPWSRPADADGPVPGHPSGSGPAVPRARRPPR